MNRAIGITIIALLLILIATGRLNESDTTVPESSGTKWTGKQELEQATGEQKSIAIPGQSEMYFNAGQIHQRVNIYNPEENDCSMIFTLEVDGEAIWKSGECYPGFGFYEIDLSRSLEAGQYSANLVHECYRDGTQLNTANVSFSLIVI